MSRTAGSTSSGRFTRGIKGEVRTRESFTRGTLRRRPARGRRLRELVTMALSFVHCSRDAAARSMKTTELLLGALPLAVDRALVFKLAQCSRYLFDGAFGPAR